MFFIGGMDLNLLRFLWSRARSDTPTLREDAPQNRLRNGQGLMELGPQSASFSVVEGSFGYPHAPTSICFVFCGRGLVRIPPRSVKTLPKTVYETDLNLLRFLWSRARSDTPTLREDAPQNRLRNGQGLVELGPQSASFSVVEGSFG
ncbi:uncharacterized protein LACBIDRAFT_335663 [Laccaria bicolor S238N-H82]|uniref:Predicted protein n=1 Tax=Laccaria bicolor (strain S238N-H82 / ATCC MYA-4686) TaxID=486041 RepID=B0E300_LACBS|nr:uncharacterized protein LACBIDRAFT_335663 [Laccaria bicolor S238N-H82]EDQ98779.1 predicted protein [Laccaria bicolor S238N-H82]|eukprot:XP_001890568.1 predicted protein [Laccaria bicolor S238N-H82]